MKVHFVCTGNIFRSRLAEGYFAFLLTQSHHPNISATSSGVMASSNQWGSIGWFTRELLEKENILSFASTSWTQTTAEILQSQDLVIFMEAFHLQYCQRYFNYSVINHKIWNIPDIEPDMTDSELLSHAAAQFAAIKSHCQTLLASI